VRPANLTDNLLKGQVFVLITGDGKPIGCRGKDHGLDLDPLAIHLAIEQNRLGFHALDFLVGGVKNPREARFFSTRTKSRDDFAWDAWAGELAADRDWKFRGENFSCAAGVAMTPRPFSCDGQQLKRPNT
jgi:hypothetical protein